MSYQTQKDKIKIFIEEKILPQLKKNPYATLDYYKTINTISGDTMFSRSQIEDTLNFFIMQGKIQEMRTLSLSDEEIEKVLQFKAEEEKAKEKLLTEDELKENLEVIKKAEINTEDKKSVIIIKEAKKQ